MADHATLVKQGEHQTKYDRKRLNELFRYFHATSRAIQSKPPDIESSSDYSQYLPRLAADPNLNALAQLGALRLNCERSFISLIDSQHQHIIAEATRSISLYDAEIHTPGEQLSMGETPLDLFAGVCAGTMPIFTSQAGGKIDTQNIYADQSRYVINDFTQEDLYKDRPYVVGYPHMRYYAEVPLKTRSGYVIGSYCVVDSKPRTGLEDQAFRTLNEIASAIMRHLDLIKTNDDHKRSIRMLEGLHRFAQGGNMVEGSERNSSSVTPSTDASSFVELEEGDETPVALPERPSLLVQSLSNAQKASHSAGIRHNLVMNSTEEPIPRGEDNAASPPMTSPKPGPQTPEGSGNGGATVHEHEVQRNLDPGAPETLVADKVDDTKVIFDKAAVTLCRAMDLDGVYFLDASAKAGQAQAEHGGLTRQQGEKNPGERVLKADSSGSLKLSSALKSPLVPPEVSLESSSEKFLGLSNSVQQTLIREYPSGHIFNFDDRGRIPESAQTMKPAFTSNMPLDLLGTSVGAQNEDHPEVDVALRRALPGVTSVIFIPLWNAHKGSWFSSLLAWTNDARRVLLQEDLSYCSAFGNSIMAEVTRVALVLTDQAKSDFISSMSHELRSPLHGILASAEFLRGM
ncbi:hypothetical protein H2200_009941 [Cladophialophora chaetospira]|uniref:Signal transduction histidine kinase dimerisation/phosphoacceptor domain-containing protein n=1 Tax=Cladophialophora chaetospira TaxID=386627 RepID=A0AA39CEJ0_9EURO|nr:hypothetical protein H2200_009941 [Cladophialophora chaetospira]